MTKPKHKMLSRWQYMAVTIMVEAFGVFFVLPLIFNVANPLFTERGIYVVAGFCIWMAVQSYITYRTTRG